MPRIIRSNEISSTLAIDELAFTKKKKKQKKKNKNKTNKQTNKTLIYNSIQIYDKVKAVVHKQNGAINYIVALLPLSKKKKKKKKKNK
jgi:hypothetical protein